MKKTLIIAAILTTAFAAPSMAGQYKNKGDGYGHGHHGKVTKYERFRIQQARKRVQRIKLRARADGYVTPFERKKIRRAENQLRKVIMRARRT